MESLIKLTVKTPNQRIEDIQIDCDLQWTVRKLKEYLQDVYPSKPASSSQRLIYLGKLLQDHDLLQEVFGEWGARTLHLVCTEVSGSIEESTTEKLPTTDATVATTTVSSPTTVPNVTTDSTDGLRYRGLTHQNSVPSSLSGMQSPFMSTVASSPNLAQWYQFHQQHQHQQQQQHPWSNQYHMHMHQYYQQWQQWQMNQAQWPYNQVSSGQFSTPPSSPAAVPPNIPAPPQEQQQQPQQAQPNEQNVRMNAGMGGPVVDDEEDNDNPRNRDWLDWLYMSLRVLMLFSIIYFYSSTSRFLLVGLLFFIVYLYQGGWFTPRRRVPPRPEPANEVPNQNERNDNNENNQAGGESIDNNEPATVVEPPRPSVLRVICTFLVSFVTSIIPAAPPVIQQQ